MGPYGFQCFDEPQSGQHYQNHITPTTMLITIAMQLPRNLSGSRSSFVACASAAAGSGVCAGAAVRLTWGVVSGRTILSTFARDAELEVGGFLLRSSGDAKKV